MAKVVLRNMGRAVRLALIVAVGVATLTATIAVAAPHVAEIAEAHRFEQDAITLQPLSERSYVYDAQGGLIATFVDEENRVQVDIEDVPRTVIDSILTAEDSSFYSHKGVNARSIGRAFTANIESGGVAQGGSTITQQVVKNAIDEKDQDFARKVREAVLAVQLEDDYTKDEILEYYINTIYFGSGAYGVQAAAETYFNKDVADLTWAEGAMLGGIIRCPTSCDPLNSKSRALARRNTVLDALVTTGRLERSEADINKFAPLPEQSFRPDPPEDYFVEEVKKELLADERLGSTPTARFNRLYGGGLRVYTTLDRRLYLEAVASRDATLPGNNGDATFTLPPDSRTGAARIGTAAMAGVEPSTGAVRFIVGGPGFERYQYDLALGDQRAVGSTFKPFVLAQAFLEGLSSEDLINGAGPCGDVPGYPEDDPPGNYGGSRGTVDTLRDQTKRSSNCAFLRLNQIVGPQEVADLAHEMGITSDLSPEAAAMPLGPDGVSPLDMASAYSVFANDGIRNDPYFIDRVEDVDGNIVFAHEADPHRVLPEQVARAVTDVLEENVESGTGTNARISRPAAGKTGTTNGPSDVWFVGYVPQLSVSVWMGGTSDNQPLSGEFSSATGGKYPARTWGDFMAKATDGLPVQQFIPPDPPERGERLCMPTEERRCR